MIQLWQFIADNFFEYSDEDPVIAHQGYLLSFINFVLTFLMFFWAGLWVLGFQGAFDDFYNLFFPLPFLLLYVLTRLRYIQLASIVTVFAIVLLVFIKSPAYITGGILACAVLLAGLLLGSQAMYMVALFMSLIPLLVNWGGLTNYWFINTLITTVIYLILAYGINQFAWQQRFIWERTTRVTLIKEVEDDLQQQLESRTQELERTFEIMEQFSHIAVTHTDLQILFKKIIHLVRETLDIKQIQGFVYHQTEQKFDCVVNVDDLLIDESLLSAVILAKHKLIVKQRNLIADPTFGFGKRIELAIPLLHGQRVIGVINFISSNLFDEKLINLLELLANQLAMALGNIQAVSETQQALRQVEALNRQITHQKWSQMFVSTSTLGYIYTPHTVKPTPQDWLEQVDETFDNEQDLVVKRTETHHELALPLRLRGKMIGMLALERICAQPWSEDEISALKAVTEQITLALESARLFENTQRNAWRDQIISESTAKVWASTEIEGVMQAAVAQLGQKLNASEVVIQLTPHTEID